MKILELSPFSDGICGVWSRVSQEAKLLASKGHDVTVFSSNIKRGSGKIEYASERDKVGGVKIRRFKTRGSFGQNSFFWNCKKQVLELKPDVIIAHAYRQYYSTKALQIAKKLKIPCILVTHAPFLEKKLRSWKLNLAVKIYDNFIGRRILNKYSKILAITKWELPSLAELGVKKEKIIYIPNGIPKEFFTTKLSPSKTKIKNKVLFFGRLAPIKNITLLIKAFKIASEKNKEISLTLVGPIEKDYEGEIRLLIKKLGLENKVHFEKPVYDLKEKIKVIDKFDTFVLPSNREAMPQALIEVMSREKVVISSNTEGGKEIIKNNENGFLFEIGNEKQLAKKILKSLENTEENKRIRKNARESVKIFEWGKIIDKIENILKKEIHPSKAL